MWNLLVIVVMAALGGFYLLPAERGHIAAGEQLMREQAGAMGIYRQAVITYFSLHDQTDTSVDISTLRASGLLPAWSPLASPGAAPAWANYRDSAGVIYIYPLAQAAPNMVGEVLKLSHNSMNVGVYRAADHSLYSPLDGARVALAAGTFAIPDGAPVWMAARN
ncbi:hypothetical protein [Duganella radicis]|uniref:Pilus assembly protein PilM n=1 Tax=Duganella radicis TaxID=551988 RepID=A0A6L6PSF6_9BURK|nr:hypothetical protein [Duganella radicis]MTV41729.1 hypothetical protein [Duganella radicis]